MKIAVVQLNPKIGDFAGNGERMLRFLEKARNAKVDLVVFPELATTGYPPADLLDYDFFVDKNLEILARLQKASAELHVVCGYVERNSASHGKPYFNSAAVFHQGKLVTNYRKQLLPYYDVFDEERYFEAGTSAASFVVGGKKIALSICEDLWNRPGFLRRPYATQPLDAIRASSPDVILNLSASPFELGKPERRMELFRMVAHETGATIVVAGQAGANDDLLFDGGSALISPGGDVHACAPAFEETLVLGGDIAAWPESEGEWIQAALETGIRDYAKKVGVGSVCLGLSGGVDSSVVAVLAARALGPDKVKGIALPTRFTSRESLEDAEALARALGIGYEVISIEPMFQAAVQALSPKEALTSENIQPRLRMTFLMARSNDENRLLLNTSNKSEITTGYATLYGDSAGALAVLGDLTKRQVYLLARRLREVPERVLTRPPTAELKENQTDQDTLPLYDQLDRWVVEKFENRASISDETFNRLYGRSEYKRHQLPPALKISSRAFGRGRRIPIAAASLVDGPKR